jgi:hypothetical protein
VRSGSVGSVGQTVRECAMLGSVGSVERAARGRMRPSFHGSLHPMKHLLREPVVEWDDPHQRLRCSCSKMPI